jgi:RecA-family ATPase
MTPPDDSTDPFYQAAIEVDQSQYWEPMDALESVASGFDDPKVVQLGVEKRHAPQIECEMFDYLDETPIPAIPWLFGRWIIRREVTVIVSPGGVGKSTLCAGIAHSLMSGLEFMGQRVWAGKHKVWLMNLEDDRDQMRRAIKSTFIHHKPSIEDCQGSMFFTSGMNSSLVTAYETKNGTVIHEPVFDDLKASIIANGISTIIVDPFVSSHRVNENDNGIIDEVAKRWKRLAYETNSAILRVVQALWSTQPASCSPLTS